MLFSPSLLLVFYIFLSSISIIKASLEDYDKYYKYRTIDEILYTIRAFEDYLFEKKIPIERNIHIFYQERIHLISYIRNTIIIQYPLFEDINLFLSNIIPFSFYSTSEEILFNSPESEERGFLVRWAINCEKYKRKQNNQSDLIGGLIDYVDFMKAEDLKQYIIDIITEFPQLKSRELFDIEILNLKKEDLPSSTLSYVLTKSRKEVISYIVHFEHYLDDIVKREKPEISYTRDVLFKMDQSNLLPILYSFIRNNKEMMDLDTFINLIEYKNSSHFSPFYMLEYASEDDLISWLQGCEKYHKKNINISKSFRDLDKYIKLIPRRIKIITIMKMLKNNFELAQEGRINDIISSDNYLQYGKVKEFLYAQTRDSLIKYYLNINSYFNNTNIFNEELNSIFRVKTSFLPDKIISLTNHINEFQTQQNFINAANLYKGNVNNFLGVQPRNILLQ